MFDMLSLVAELREVRDLDLNEEEVEGFLDMFFESLFENAEEV